MFINSMKTISVFSHSDPKFNAKRVDYNQYKDNN